MHIIIVGCGDVGTRVGLALIDAGHKVTGVRRSADRLPDAFNAVAADVGDVESLRVLATSRADLVIYALAASEFTDAGYETAYVRGVHNTINVLQGSLKDLRRFMFVSSSSVYHQHQHEWVDERSPTRPTRFGGQRILQGEDATLGTGIGTVVRFSGIYGPERRRLINKVREGTITAKRPLRFTNRIHIEDCAKVLTWLGERAMSGQSLQAHYLATDSQVASASEVEAFIAQRLGVRVTEATTASTRNPGSKRCRNTRLVTEGYQFVYPGFEQGYSEIVDRVLAES